MNIIIKDESSRGRYARILCHVFLTLISAVCLSILMVLMSGSIAHADKGGRDILGEGSDYTSILYDSTNGLPTSEANAIVQSADGFIWLGGYSGLIRYDGSSFYRFDSSNGISSVFSLYVDSHDRVWVGTNENGVALYDHGDIRVYGRVEGLKSYSIRAITEDTDGNIIIATTQGLAYIGAEDLEIHVIDDPQVNMEYITELQRDTEGSIYGLTLSGAVFTVESLRIGAFYPSEQFGGETLNTIYADPQTPGQLYMGTQDSSLLTVDAHDSMRILKRRSVAPQKNLNEILFYRGYIWLTATNGIGYIDEAGVYHALTDVPMTNSVGDIMVDHEGNIWFTSTRQGFMKLVPDRFTDISKLAELPTMVVNSTCVRDDELYLGTDGGLVIVDMDGYDTVENELTAMLEGVRIRCILKDSQDNLWLCTHGDTGLVCYDRAGAITVFNSDNGLDAGRVRAAMELSDGRIAAATGNGLYIVGHGAVEAHYGQGQGISNTEILSVAQSPDGRLFLGSDGDGIYVVDGQRVSRIGHEDGLTSGVVIRIKWDAERELFWLITSNSIEHMSADGSGISAVTTFPYSNNYDIVFDSHGGAWVLSSNGIYITRVDELIADEGIEYSFYNTRSGLPYIATGNSRSYLDGEGHLYISGTTGVASVDIDGEDVRPDLVKLIIPSVGLDDRTIYIRDSSEVTVPAGTRRLTINAYALTYGLSNPRITYMLEGFDDEEIHTTKQELVPVIYTNLDGGRYTFHLRVIDDTTGEVDNSVALSIIKERSIYENVWFWLLTVGALVALIALLMYLHFSRRTAALIAKREEDQRFIDQIIRTFAKCIDMRDTQNRGHSFRVAYYTRLLTEKLAEKRGYTAEQIAQFRNVALLHDIGKLSIPDRILNKPERLDDDEFVIMKSHAEKGEEILKDVDIVKDLSVGAGCHHERMDGKGYPKGLKGEEIPEVARIIAVADTFDAMYSTRPYRKQMLLSDVLDEIRRIKGTQLEPEVVDCLLELAEDGMLDREKVDAAIAEGG